MVDFARSTVVYAYLLGSALVFGFVLSACGSQRPGTGHGTAGAAGMGGAPGMCDALGDLGNADFCNGSRLKFPLWRTADDFAQRQGTIYDSVRREHCTFGRAADDKWRCLPQAGASVSDGSYFANAACTDAVAVTGSSAEAVANTLPPYAVFRLPSPAPACETPQWEYRELGAQLRTGETLYSLTGAGCVSTVLGPVERQTYFRAGRVLPPDLFVAAEEVVVRPPVAARCPLGEVQLRAEDGASIRLSLVDVLSGKRCAPEGMTDGSIRCVPTARYQLSTAADLCGGPRVAVASACAVGEGALVAHRSLTCPHDLRLYQAGPAWSGTECAGGPPPAVIDPTVEVGPELSPDTFVELAVRHAGTGRLRATQYFEELGAWIPAAEAPIYDSVLEESCTFKAGPDGQVRCVPPTLFAAFRDAACTDPVGVAVDIDACVGEPAQKYVGVNGRVYRRGAELTPSPAQLFSVSTEDSACRSDPGVVGGTYRHYAVGAEVDLVAATALMY
ncbi:MAG: hypothetical protein ABIS92_07700 [Polyangia bacterium]